MARDGAMPSRATLRGYEVQRQSVVTRAIRPRAKQLMVQTWQSQANLSLFFELLVISTFVLPAPSQPLSSSSETSLVDHADGRSGDRLGPTAAPCCGSRGWNSDA